MKVTGILAFVAVPLLILTQPLMAADGWTSLFNGTNLDGWEIHGGKAKYHVEDGCIVGESVTNTGNSFICTTQTFANFELELEYKCAALLNSGVQIRGEVFSKATNAIIGGKEYKFAADRVHGYQCEIDMDTARGRMWTGGIYDEARRGWLFPSDGEKGKAGLAFSEQGRKVAKNDDWNKLRIVCDGSSIKTWWNGEPRAVITDDVTARGVIALQVHEVGSDPKKTGLRVYFRNIRINDLKSAAR